MEYIVIAACLFGLLCLIGWMSQCKAVDAAEYLVKSGYDVKVLGLDEFYVVDFDMVCDAATLRKLAKLHKVTA